MKSGQLTVNGKRNKYKVNESLSRERNGSDESLGVLKRMKLETIKIGIVENAHADQWLIHASSLMTCTITDLPSLSVATKIMSPGL